MTRRDLVSLGCVAGVLVPLLCTQAAATTIVPYSDARLVDRAPVILHGEIVGVLPATTDEAVTDWLVDVVKILKGSVPGHSLTLRTPGGFCLRRRA